MAETDVAPIVSIPAVTSSLAKKEKKAKNPRTNTAHPPTSDMVNNAIKSLKERGGSSLQAIKKYIAANYKVDAEKVGTFIKKYLKAAVVSGALVQTKGKGASGSFKLSSSISSSVGGGSSTTSSKQISGVKRKAGGTMKAKGSPSAANKPKKSVQKITSRVKKIASEEKKSIAKKSIASASTGRKATAARAATGMSSSSASTAAIPKSKFPSKAKKSTKGGPTKKPKAPKPKTSRSVAAVSSKAKKVASPKRKK